MAESSQPSENLRTKNSRGHEMLNTKSLVALYTFLLLPALGIAVTDTAGTLTELDAYLDETASQLGDSPFAAVVSKNGEILYERYYDGQGVLERTVDQHARWRVFSITKSFVSALVLRLCQDELISLEDPVGKYLPDFTEHGDGPFDRRAVTIRHLMSHTSGAAVASNKTPEILPPSFDRIEIITAPGTAFEYSSLGMLILERTLEAATGKDLADLLNERIIEPLGLESTGYVYPGSATDVVLPLRKDLYHYSQNGRRAGSGLFATARDLNAFGQFWLDPEPMFSHELRTEAWTHHGMRESGGESYGLMWWLLEQDGGYVMSGREFKINAVVPETNSVITVIRYPQSRAAKEYNFAKDKRAMVLFGKRL
jgi:CubicO group peptidase (beta-lactamase class C family)